MVKMNEELKALFGEWQDNIRKEIDRIKMDNTAKVDEILALRNAIRKNEDELAAIKGYVYAFASEVFEIADSARDYAAYVADTVDEIEDYHPDKDNDEDEEPITYCNYCGKAIWNEDEIVYGYKAEYCCDECRIRDGGEDNLPKNEVEVEV